MEIFLIFCIVVVGLVMWRNLRTRMGQMEAQIQELTSRVYAQELRAKVTPEPVVKRVVEPVVEKAPVIPVAPVMAVVGPPLAEAAPVAPEPIVWRQLEPEPVSEPVMKPVPQAAPPSREWETILGGSWLNKIGVFVLVVGLALLLRYSFTQFGPLGRVAICLAASAALLAGGVVLERRERYRMFARGLLGGGWAALYVTVYAMHAVESARVVSSPVIGAILLLAVALGMIAHALRYRSQTVAGLAYFVAFATLAITDMASLPFLALVPLAASLLYVAHRFAWVRMALFGLVATYGVVVMRGDSGAPLWQAQAIFIVYWLLFEIFDVLHPEAWLLPLNAAGALGLSVLKWQTAAPDRVWMLLAAAAVAYLIGGALRIRSGKWQGAATLMAGLAAAAIFQKLDHQWIASALAVEAELLYLAGLRLRAPYLRWLGTSLFGVEVLRLVAIDVWVLPAEQWTPVASLDAVAFYANRALYAADEFYGYAGAGMVAVVIGKRTSEPYRSVLWQSAAAGAFAFGWWKRLFDFRLQGYLLLVLGLAGTAIEMREFPLAVAVPLCYAAVLCALWSVADRFRGNEGGLLRLGGAGAAVLAATGLVWRLVPDEYLGVAWMALAVLLLELGMRRLPEEFRRMSYALAAIGGCMVWAVNRTELMPAYAAVLAYAIAVRARNEERGMVLTVASSAAAAFGLLALWVRLPAQMVAASWALAALALLLAARTWKRAVFGWQSCVVAALAYLWSMAYLLGPATSAVCVAIACFYAGQFVSRRDTRQRLYFSLLATTLLTWLLCMRISGSMLTIACGAQGVILLASGFPLRDRVLRISGLALLLACILKLFVWDLRHLDTLPRIFSFIVLGVILLAVSWIYTRFRERVAKFL